MFRTSPLVTDTLWIGPAEADGNRLHTTTPSDDYLISFLFCESIKGN